MISTDAMSVSRAMIDPELLPLLDMYPSMDVSAATLEAVRATMRGDDTASAGRGAGQEVYCPGPLGAPDVRSLLYRPDEKPGLRPAFLHIHGGGFVAGSPDMNDADNRLLAADARCVVLSVDYRLAPETPHPGPLEDCYAALRWLHDQAGALGVDTRRIAIGGESAGGGLAAALALLARDRGDVPIVLQALIQPMLDDRTAITRTVSPLVGHFMWTRASNRFVWRALLGDVPTRGPIDRYAVPARMRDLRGLPATFIVAAALDLFVEENISYARRLLDAGNAVELHLYPGAVHGFEMMPDAAIAKALRRDLTRALCRAFA